MKKSIKIFSMVFAVFALLTVIYACSSVVADSDKFSGTFVKFDSENSSHRSFMKALAEENDDNDYSYIRKYAFNISGKADYGVSLSGGYNIFVDENQFVTDVDGKTFFSLACCCGLGFDILPFFNEENKLCFKVDTLNTNFGNVYTGVHRGDRFTLASDLMPDFGIETPDIPDVPDDVIEEIEDKIDYGIFDEFESVYYSQSGNVTLLKFVFSTEDSKSLLHINDDKFKDINDSSQGLVKTDVIDISRFDLSLIWRFENNIYKGFSIDAYLGTNGLIKSLTMNCIIE